MMSEAEKSRTVDFDLEAMRNELASSDRSRRYAALQELDEYIDASRHAAFPAAMDGLLDLVVRSLRASDDADINGQLLYVVGRGFVFGAPDISLEPLVKQMSALSSSLLEYAIPILGLSHRPAYADLVRGYLSHESPSVRSVAELAMVELAGRRQRSETDIEA